MLGKLIFLGFLLCGLPGSWRFSLEGRVKEFTLENGMKVLFLERHQSPTMALYIRFRVGAADENIGMTGTAHLLEHMLFKGTQDPGDQGLRRRGEDPRPAWIRSSMAMEAEKSKGEKASPEYLKYLQESMKSLQEEHKKYVIKDEIERVYSQNGGVGFNAMTSADTTTYVVSLPSNRLELWARVESDRLLNPVLREFYSERDVVLEERRRSIDSQPERILLENFLAVSFIAHPYGRPDHRLAVGRPVPGPGGHRAVFPNFLLPRQHGFDHRGRRQGGRGPARFEEILRAHPPPGPSASPADRGAGPGRASGASRSSPTRTPS